MLRRKLHESLTVRIFLITLLILLGAGAITFALIAWATPITYTAVISDRLQAQVADLTQQLAQTNLADAGPILDAFVRESGAEVALTAPGGAEADTGSLLVLPEEDWQVAVTMSGADNSVQTYEADTYQVQIDRADGVVTATQTGILTTQITFADQEGTYQLLVSPQLRLANQAVEALGRVAPWLALALLAFSLLCAFGYSRYITRPIVRLNGIAGRMAELDLQWVCGERRRDEIGQLGRSLDKMARRLSAALTDLETANQALRGEVARERELDRQRMAFFSAASHELKTPLASIRLLADSILQSEEMDRETLRDFVSDIGEEADRLTRITEHLLSLTRLDSLPVGATQIVDLAAVARRALSMLAPVADAAQVTVEASLRSGCTLRCTEDDLYQICFNLMENAIKYNLPGGKVFVSVCRDGDQVLLEVADTGIGIPEEELPKVFNRFYRVDKARSRAAGGTGLGLSIVRDTVRRHGGWITAQRRQPEGSVFTAGFPCETPEVGGEPL